MEAPRTLAEVNPYYRGRQFADDKGPDLGLPTSGDL
ncbi:hypothetical protein GA0115246_1121319 [Streptomyces sp. SolWspMP-sol7th]|nr:hypothetical protein GA0115246_1121319 [Streptomyces sp. SolWspMP-sol7th]